MTTTITPLEASRRVLEFAHENRLIQGFWHTERDGKHLACLLGAMSNGVVIDSPEKCPASLMPEWMAHLVVWLFDEQRQAEAVAWAQRFGEQMGHPRWEAIGWERVRVEFLVWTITAALESARPRCEKASYWAAVEGAHRLVVDALRGNGDLSAARSAASAASAAANAAWSAAAWSAANAAWSAAANAAASAAARSAASAANAAANAAASAAAWSAASAAWSAAANAAANAAWSAAANAAASAAANAAASAAAWSAASAAARSAASAAARSAASAQATKLSDLIDAELATVSA